MPYNRPPIKGAFATECSAAKKVTYCSITYVSLNTCEGNGCPLLNNGCMAQHGNMNIHSQRCKTDDAQLAIQNEAQHIRHLSGRFPLRLRESGDQPDEESLVKHTAPAARAYHNIRGAPVWTYTHNWRKIDVSKWDVISVLASVHSVEEVRTANNRGYAAALLLPSPPAKVWKEDNNTFVRCPAETKGMLCIDCQLCMKSKWLKQAPWSTVLSSKCIFEA